jgi:hypothetical protein
MPIRAARAHQFQTVARPTEQSNSAAHNSLITPIENSPSKPALSAPEQRAVHDIVRPLPPHETLAVVILLSADE